MTHDSIIAWTLDFYVQATVAILVGAAAVCLTVNRRLQLVALRATVLAILLFAFSSCFSAWPRVHFWSAADRSVSDQSAGESLTSESFSGSGLVYCELAGAKLTPTRLSAHWSGVQRDLLALMSWSILLGVSLISMWLLVGWVGAEFIRFRATPISKKDLARFKIEPTLSRRIFISTYVDQPVAVGFLRSVILIPTRFLDSDSDEFDSAVRHEWAHIQSGDVFFRCLTHWLVALLYCHPGYWWLRRRCELTEELCADHVASGGKRMAYAEHLLQWARIASGPFIAPHFATAKSKSQLRLRIESLLSDDGSQHDQVSSCKCSAFSFPLLIMLGLLSVFSLRPDSNPSKQRHEPAATNTRAKIENAKPAKLADSNQVEPRVTRVKLPGGLAMQLVGIRQLNDVGDATWTGYDSLTDGTNRLSELVVDMSGPLQSNIYWQIAGQADLISSQACGTAGQTRVAVSLPVGEPIQDLRFGYGVGNWTTHSSTGCGSFSDKPIQFSTCTESVRGVLLSIDRDFTDHEIRVIVIDQNGHRHRSYDVECQSDDLTAAFPDIQAGDINEILVEARPLHWVELRDLSLSKGSETNVRISAAPTSQS